MRPSARRFMAILCTLVMATLGAAAVQGDHVQTGSGKAVAFDHRTGNEYWVEVVLSGTSPGAVVRVEAMDEGGPWVALEKKSWGAWGGSFRIEPTHPVKFRASWSDGTAIESCWFSHPAGVESCLVPSGWTARRMSDLGGSHGGGDMAVGDGDNDGREEVYVPSSDAIHVMRWTSAGWARTSFGQEASAPSYGAIAVGDANNDGRREVWATTIGGAVMFEWSGSAWVRRATVNVGSPGALTVGDVDDDGRRELYASGYDNQVHVVTMSGYTPTARVIATLPEGTAGLWIGDGDGDGDRELAVVTEYKGVGGIYLVDHTPAGGSVTQVAHVSGGRAIATGDADRDGRSEIYTAATLYLDDGPHEGLLQSRLGASGWVTIPVAHIPGIDDITFGDADNDGRHETYTSSAPVLQPSRIHQVSWAGSWSTGLLTTLAGGAAGAIALGDADGDGLREAYAMAFRDWSTCCNNVDAYWVANHAAPAFPAGAFDATFTGVKGNSWWLQVTATANQPIWGVDYRLGSGAWTPMRLESWGAWTASPHVVEGTQVQFRARTAQAHDVRVCVNGPAGTADVYLDGTLMAQGRPVRDPSYPGSLRIGEPVDGGFNWGEYYTDSVTLKQGCGSSATTLQTFGLNDLQGWTVQISNGFLRTESTGASTGWAHMWRPSDREGYAQGTAPLASFDRAGSFEISTRFLVPTTDNHWFYVLDGAGVAVIIDHGTDLAWYNGGTERLATLLPGEGDASGCYRWSPSGGSAMLCAGAQPPPPSGFDASFSNVKGNDWWVEAKVTANQAIAKVEARVNCGSTWQTLTLESWGSYAKSFNVPSGSKVDFRATSTSGATDLSGGYVWPQATPTSAC